MASTTSDMDPAHGADGSATERRATPTRLRRDLIVHASTDGDATTVELVDTLLERVVPVPPALGVLPEPGGTAQGALADWLTTQLLSEGPAVDGIRAAGWAARARRTVHQPRLAPVDGPWELARELPAWVSEGWRRPERWRRLAEQRAAGTRLLRMPELIAEGTATAWAAHVRADAADRCDNPYAQGWWRQDTTTPEPWRRALLGGPLHTLLSAACGVVLPSEIQLNAWRLHAGDRMALHADGTRYAATVSLGLSAGWRAADGGAIAFGWPTADGLSVQERWLPHLGDALLFAVEATLWHAVEPVQAGERLTLTGQYLLDAP